MLGNSAVCESLDPTDIVEAAKLGHMYHDNKCTPAIRDHLHSLAAQKGLFGMLQQTTEPFQHSGYVCGTLSEAGCDTDWLQTTPSCLAALSQDFIGSIKASAVSIYGAQRLAEPPSKPVLLQTSVDLLCHDTDMAKMTTAQQRQEGRLAAAAAAIGSVAAAATALAAAGVRGDESAAVQATAAMVAAAAELAGQVVEDGIEQGAAASTLAGQATAAAAAGASPVLLRGGGLVMLVPPSWSSRGRQLGGRVSLGGVSYSHYTVAQLMTADGLLLSGGQQMVSIRVPAEFLSSGEEQTGQWSKKAYSIELNPQHTLMLHCQPQHRVMQRFRGDSEAASKGYRALYASFTDAAVNARLGEAHNIISPPSLYFCVAICVHKDMLQG